MFDNDKRVPVRHNLEQGVSKAEIARRLKIRRRAVYHWIAGETSDRLRSIPNALCSRDSSMASAVPVHPHAV